MRWLPEVGQYVRIFEQGNGWYHELVGHVLNITDTDITIGQLGDGMRGAYSLELDDDMEIELQEPRVAYNFLRKQANEMHEQRDLALENQRAEAAKVARLRKALAAVGTPEALIDLLESGL